MRGCLALVKKAFLHVLLKVMLHSYFVWFLIKSPKQIAKRIIILRRFRRIHRTVSCAHSEAELLRIADEILTIPSNVTGDLIECGVWKGGSTCKLSIVAKMTGRKLIACDSFKGLPQPAEYDRVHFHSNGTLETYKRGDYAAPMEEVKTNLHKFGEAEYVVLIKGYFNETLPKLRGARSVLVFIDADLQTSTKCCIQNLWPTLAKGCKFFVHEAHHTLTVKLLTDKELWKQMKEDKPPEFVGASKGLSKLEPCLGYLKKY